MRDSRSNKLFHEYIKNYANRIPHSTSEQRLEWLVQIGLKLNYNFGITDGSSIKIQGTSATKLYDDGGIEVFIDPHSTRFVDSEEYWAFVGHLFIPRRNLVVEYEEKVKKSDVV